MGRVLLFSLLAIVVALPAACCGRDRPSAEDEGIETVDTGAGAFEEETLSGRVRADGSSTVAPLLTVAAERFRRDEPAVRVTVGVSGTGGGFERFCRGETDLSNASRPIEDDEKAKCAKNRIEYLELHVANDGLSVVVNPENTWAKCLTVAELKKIWAPGSKVNSWDDVRRGFPNDELELFGAGTDSGTFDYFTEAIVGDEGASRSDYTASEDDNVTVRGVAGDKGALGYLGLSYVEQNRGKLKAVEIDGGNGCVAPSAKTVQGGTYKPLSRPLLVYVKKSALERLEVDAFLEFVFANYESLAKRALFVPLTAEQAERSVTVLEGAATDVE
jgi:phosphate transport system substrate-binding protein